MMGSIQIAMESASQSLLRRDYLACESSCLESLAGARELGDWGLYARILMPLQESRRQRRLIAADGPVRLGTWSASGAEALTPAGSGCVVVTAGGAAAATALHKSARRGRSYVEVLLAEAGPGDGEWRLRSFAGPSVSCVVAGPWHGWRDRWVEPRSSERDEQGRTAGDWFITASEALGDAARAAAGAEQDLVKRLAALEASLLVVDDHELIHQDLFRCARALQRRQG